MKAPIGWLKDFTPIGVSVKEFCDRMTMSGSKVEGVESPGDRIENVVVGHILSVAPHPNADRLRVCSLDVGRSRPLSIVTGAANVAAGQHVPVALDGAMLPDGTRIHAGTLRGEPSEGMLCSMQELGLTAEDLPDADPEGILVLPDTSAVGQRIQGVLDLDETVVDFEITSNRPDCFCMEGLGREAAVTLGTRFTPVVPAPTTDAGPSTSSCARVAIETPDLCSRYVGRVVHNVKIGPSPDWMRSRLRHAGMRPVNNIVDITNYVMLEIGQPMHAFDLERVRGGRIIVRRALPGETLRTLDGTDRALDTGMCVIADEAGAVAVAGVMGGENSEIHEGTATLLLESACFDPIHVRMAAKRLGMRTEASSRFEKGLDARNCMRAMDRACELMVQIGCGEPASDAIEDWPIKKEAVRIAYMPQRINDLLGIDLPEPEIRGYLEAVGCGISDGADGGIAVLPPSWRPDLLCDADLAEEVARFYGYNRIPATLLSGKETTQGGRNERQKLQETVKDAMVSQGFYESCTYSFESPRVLDLMRLPAGDPLRDAIQIRNPLGEEYGMMRTSMLPSLLRVAALNASRSAPAVRIFEIAYTYHPKQLPVTGLPEERKTLACCLYAKDDGETLFLQLKGALEEAEDRLGTPHADFLAAGADTPSYLHPGKTAALMAGDLRIGWMGYLHPTVADSFDVPDNTVYMELYLDPLLDRSTVRRSARPLPRFPSVTRDLAILVDRDMAAGDLLRTITEQGGTYLDSVRLFDIYQGKQVAEGKKSAAFTLVFQAPDRTLTDDEVAEAMQGILSALEMNHKARLR